MLAHQIIKTCEDQQMLKWMSDICWNDQGRVRTDWFWVDTGSMIMIVACITLGL